VQSHKGNYSETLNAGIAAFRAGEQPHILMVFEVGTATMMAAEGAIKPVYRGDGARPAPISTRVLHRPVKGYYTTPDGRMLSLPYNSSTPVLWVNRDMLRGRARPRHGPLDLAGRSARCSTRCKRPASNAR
jgi:sn-glycerol 3-phosphate transport system substrate-binding protein